MSATIRDGVVADREAVVALLEREGLESEFVAEEFVVADAGGAIVGCARLKPLADGSHELASVAVAPGHRGTGIGRRLVRTLVARATGPVHALALAPGFFEGLGFRRAASTPVVLADKAASCCAGSGYVPMALDAKSSAWRAVQDTYGAIAVAATTGASAGCCLPSKQLPQDVPADADLGLGTGDPVGEAALKPGETVVDLGSGPGGDVLRAARQVGPSGVAIGVDVTPSMVEHARAVAEREGVTNARFAQGPIEALPLADESADVVVSNCVINLSGDQDAVLAEALRVLRPGGRLVVSDTSRLGAAGGDACGCNCTAGARTPDAWREGLAKAGFVDVAIEVEEPDGRFGEAVGTVLVRARRPGARHE